MGITWNSIGGSGNSFITGQGVTNPFRPVETGLNLLLHQNPSILLGGILPLGNVITLRVGKSKQEMKYRSFEGFFLAHQEAQNDDIAIQIICKFVGPDRWWNLLMLDMLYRWGKNETVNATFPTSALRLNQVDARTTRKLTGKMDGKSINFKDKNWFRSFPLITKSITLPRVIIETYSYSLNSNEPNTFTVHILIRKHKVSKKAPSMREAIGGRWKNWATKLKNNIFNIFDDIVEVANLMARVAHCSTLEYANQRMITLGHLWLEATTPKKELIEIPLAQMSSADTPNPSTTVVGDDQVYLNTHSMDNIASDDDTPRLSTVTGDPVVRLEKQRETLTEWVKLSGEPKNFPSFPWKFNLDMSEYGADNLYVCVLSFHETWSYDMYGDESLNQYFMLRVMDTDEETTYLNTKMVPGLSYTINEEVKITFPRLEADNFVTEGKYNLRCYVNVV